MVRIRLRRVGAKHQPSYRIVAADKESPRDGKFLEVLGHYNPRTEPSTVKVDEARLFHWLEHGAQPSDSVRRALKPMGTWERWERYKGGESLDAILKEAEEAYPDVDPRTRRDDLIGKRKKKKSAAKKAEPKVEVEPEAAQPPTEEVEATEAPDESAEEAVEAKAEETAQEAEESEEAAEEADPEEADEAPEEKSAEEEAPDEDAEPKEEEASVENASDEESED
jgi:small subunit ribosomal protein S16